jgi:hypothetical protein
VLSSAAALLDGLFEHPVGIHFQHRQAKLMGLCFITWEGRKLQEGSGQTILLARRTRTKKGMEADDLLCSRNARPEKALVGRAQWKIIQPPSSKR